MLSTKNVHKQVGNGMNYRKIADKFGVSASTACKKVNTAGTDENLLRLVPGHGARVLPLEIVPKLVIGHHQKAMFRLVPVSGHWARAASLNRA